MFNIGENINLKNNYKNISLKSSHVSILSPARLHLTAMDPQKMILEKLGGRWNRNCTRHAKHYIN